VIEVRRAADRYVTRDAGVEQRHCFSFGAHYDAANTHHGRLIACQDVVVAPGAGFAEHPHRDVEIVTWVLAGALAYRDSLGHEAVLRAGAVQRLRAGTGLRHTETNAGDVETRYVQVWLRAEGGDPTYEVEEAGGGLYDLAAGESVPVPGTAYAHVYVARGTAALDGADLAEGDSARLTGAGPRRVTAGSGGAVVLVRDTS
jgi:redox-sensitive bicupin YhaK (pirin superfamily)